MSRFRILLAAMGALAAVMSQCASEPGNFFFTPNPEDLNNIYAGIAYSFGCPSGRHDWGQPWPQAIERRIHSLGAVR